MKLLIAIVLSAASVCGGCLSTNSLEFRSPDATVVLRRFTQPGATYAWGVTDLDTVPTFCESEMTISFRRDLPAPGTVSEVLLFARDPNSVDETLAALTDDQIKAGLWDQETSVPRILPRAAVLVFPPDSTFDITTRLTIPIAFHDAAFWGIGGPDLKFLNQQHAQEFLCHRFNAASDTVEIGPSLKATVVYQGGQCQHNESLLSVVQRVAQQVWLDFEHGAIEAGVVTRTLVYSKAVSFLHHNVGDPQDVTGGFIYTFHFGANGDSDFWGTFRYDFFADERGVIDVKPTEISYHATGPWGPELGDGVAGRPGLHPSLGTPNGTLASTVRAQSLSSQTQLNQPIFEPTFGPFICDPADVKAIPARCAAAAAALAKSAIDEPTSTASFSTDQKNHLKCALGDSNACAVIGKDPNPILATHWTCGASPVAGNSPYCQFIIPVKRLNPMPDQLQTVWFDGPEFDNAAFAFSFFANRFSSGALCDAKNPAPGQTYLPRSFVSGVWP